MARLGTYELADLRFPEMIQRHRMEFPDTPVFERVAMELAQADFPVAGSLRFLRQVCRWGGYYGIAARVQKANQPETIAATFRLAFGLLERQDVVGGLIAINSLHSLGRPSFASKFLRFMAPQSAPILDAIISDRAGFSLTPTGYRELIGACKAAAERLSRMAVLNPVRPTGIWYLADIEAAFYADMEEFEL